MATLNIPDDVLNDSGLTEKDVLIEVACRLFDAQRMTMHQATRLCGLTRVQFEDALVDRNLPLIRYTEDMWREDLKSLEHMRENDQRNGQERQS